MRTLILKEIITDSSSNSQGTVFYNELVKARLYNEKLLLHIDADLSVSSSFLNSSIGAFLEEYGLEEFKSTFKFKGSKSQFKNIATYIKQYSSIYLA